MMVPASRYRGKGSLGNTLIELIVSMGVFSLVVTLVLSFLVTSARWSTDIRAYQGAEQDLSTAMEKVVRDLAQAPLSGVLAYYPSADPNQGDLVLAWTTPRTAAGSYVYDPVTFEPVYQGVKVVYLDQVHFTLLTTYIPLTTPTSVLARPLQADVQAALAPTTDRALAHGIQKFAVLHPIDQTPTDSVYNPCFLSLDSKTDRGRDQKLNLHKLVRFDY